MMNETEVLTDMRLLFVHQSLGEFGGAETNIRLTAHELRNRGHTPALLYVELTGRNEDKWLQTFCPTYRLAHTGDLEGARAALEDFKPDLIYLHNFGDLKVQEFLFNCGLPVVRMVHDHSLYCLRSYKYNYFTRRVCTRAASPYCVFPCLAPLARNHRGPLPLRWASYLKKRRELRLNRRCQALVVYSEHQKQELVRNGFTPERIATCVPMRITEPQVETSNFSDRNVVLFAGQILRGKGVDELLRALAKVRTPFECLILGEGNHRGYCERLSRSLGLGNQVRFLGYVLPQDLKRFYLQASLFVMSSLWPEPFGMAGPEAMRYGLPVVAFDAGAIPEWLKDGYNGFLAPWRDLELFAARIEVLLNDKGLARELGAHGRDWVQRYDVGRQLDILEDLLRRVAAQARPAPQEAVPTAY